MVIVQNPVDINLLILSINSNPFSSLLLYAW